MAYKNVLASKKAVEQTMAVPGKQMVENNAGGYIFALPPLKMLERFLILGSTEPTYYATAKKLTKDNADNLMKIVQATNGVEAVDLIVEISQSGRAPKNDEAIFALAVCASYGTSAVRSKVLDNLTKVCRTGTHLFQFIDHVNGMRGWGRGLKTAVQGWYLEKDPAKLAYQIVKYKNREGWTHRDVLRLAHPKGGVSVAQDGVLTYAVTGNAPETVPDIIHAHEIAVNPATSRAEVIQLIQKYGLTREMIRTDFLNDPEVWEALLLNMPLTAMLRNLGNMSKVGLLTPLSAASKVVVNKLGDVKAIAGARLHPVNVYRAFAQYNCGHGLKGSGTWTPVPTVVDALEGAFMTSFKTLEPTGKGIYVALDVSGSMGWPDMQGIPGFSPRVASAIMAMAVMRSEKNYLIRGFSNTLVDVPIRASMGLDKVVDIVASIPMGGTDCALPMIDATKRDLDVDGFVVYTDHETWAGAIHPFQALKEYRKKVGKPEAKLVVCGMTATEFSIADPSDPGMLDVVGFDSAAPSLIQSFIGGTGEGSEDEGE